MKLFSSPGRVLMHFLPVVLMLTAIPALPAQAAADDSAWNVSCTFSHSAADDPIVYPGQPGASHMHAFYGNTSTNAASTTASLLAANSTCSRGFDTIDHSSYWVPALYRTGGQLMAGPANQQHVTVYYRRGNAVSGQKTVPFPQGFRMIAGDHNATSPQSSAITNWRCSGSTQTAAQAAIPSCSATQYLDARIKFPSCWDGKNIDSTNHMSHVAYPGKNSVCPADHPVKLPEVTYQIAYKNLNGAGSQYQLSSGSQYSMHGDFFAAWDNRYQSALVNSCLNSPHKCTGIQASKINLSAATVSAGSGGQVMGTATSTSTSMPAGMDHTHMATATTASTTTTKPAAALPDTGPAAASAVGLTGIALAFLYWRRSRQTLLGVLRNKRL
jgi:hypothetical protein